MKTREHFPSFHFHSNFHVFISQYFCVLLLFCQPHSPHCAVAALGNHFHIFPTLKSHSRPSKHQKMKKEIWKIEKNGCNLFCYLCIPRLKWNWYIYHTEKALKRWKIKAHEYRCRLDRSQLEHEQSKALKFQISMLFVNYDTFLMHETWNSSEPQRNDIMMEKVRTPKNVEHFLQTKKFHVPTQDRWTRKISHANSQNANNKILGHGSGSTENYNETQIRVALIAIWLEF